MADVWSNLTGGAVHSGSWKLFGVPLPDLGTTELVGKVYGAEPNAQGGSNLVNDKVQNTVANVVKSTIPGINGLDMTAPGVPAVKGASTTDQTQQKTDEQKKQDEAAKSKADQIKSGSEYQELSTIAQKGDLNPVQKTRYQQLQDEINKASSSSQDAAAAAAEARRQSALRSYEAKKNAAGVAKEAAKGQYDWMVNTLGSNKQDTLDQVALNEKTGVQGYEQNQAETQANYDKSRKEILSTYRDLKTEQEKILRGAGVASSSRSTEAQLRLNNLMGKDLSEVSTNEADAMAQIGNALSAFKEKVVLTRNSIETESKSQADKATMDYNNNIKTIDANLQLTANEREDAYASADAQLAADTASIQKWAAGLKLQVETTISNQASNLNDFIVDMTDNNKLLGADLSTKQQATDALVGDISTSLTLDAEGNLVNPSAGVQKKKVKSLDELYDPTNVASTNTGGASSSEPNAGTVQNLATNISAKNDPLLSAMFA